MITYRPLLWLLSLVVVCQAFRLILLPSFSCQ